MSAIWAYLTAEAIGPPCPPTVDRVTGRLGGIAAAASGDTVRSRVVTTLPKSASRSTICSELGVVSARWAWLAARRKIGLAASLEMSPADTCPTSGLTATRLGCWATAASATCSPISADTSGSLRSSSTLATKPPSSSTSRLSSPASPPRATMSVASASSP